MKNILFLFFLIQFSSLFAQYQIYKLDIVEVNLFKTELKNFFEEELDLDFDYLVIDQNDVYSTLECEYGHHLIQEMCILNEYFGIEVYIARIYINKYLYFEVWGDKLVYRARFNSIPCDDFEFIKLKDLLRNAQ